MRLSEFAANDKTLNQILETASGGATGAGSVASVANPVGGIISRMPTTPNLFGYVQQSKPKNKRKKSKSSK